MPPKKTTTKQTTTETPKQNFSNLKYDVRAVPIEEWDWDRLVYGEPTTKQMPDGSGSYNQVNIKYRYDDEHIGPAIISLGKHYCFGVQPDNLDKTGNVIMNDGVEKPLKGYKIPIVMVDDIKNVKDTEQTELDFFDAWQSEVARFVSENKAALGYAKKSDAIIEELVTDVLYRKKDATGDYDETIPPKLYSSLIYYSNKREVGTVFYGPGDKEVNPLNMTDNFHICPTIRFDYIFISSKKISLKTRIYDATATPLPPREKKRLAPVNTAVEEETPTVEEGGDDAGEIMEELESEAEE